MSKVRTVPFLVKIFHMTKSYVLLSTLILFSFLSAHAENSEEFVRCYLNGNQNVYKNQSRSEVLSSTVRGFTTCRRLSTNTYEIKFGGQTVYVDKNTIARTEVLPLTSENKLSYGSSNQPSSGGRMFMGPKLSTPIKSPSIRISGFATLDNETLNSESTTAGQNITLLANQGWVPVRSEPNLAASFNCPSGVTRARCRNAQTIDSNMELKLTGKRVFDTDNRIWYVEAKFDHDGNEFSGWFDERQTSLKPFQAEVKEQTATRERDFRISEVVSGDDYVLNQSPEAEAKRAAYNSRENLYPDQYVISDEVARAQKTADAAEAFLTNRGLIKMHNNRNAVCGSREYSTGDGGDDSYANPLTACAITQLAERWRKEYCPRNTPCRLEIGDISDRSKKRFDGHKSHTDGQCVDFRPIRNTSGTDRVAHNGSGNYDRAKTEELLKLMKELGGTNIFFNDKEMIEKGLSRRIKNHDSHIHVCFKDNDTVKNQCANYEPDANMCPNADLMFNHQLMQNMKNSLED